MRRKTPVLPKPIVTQYDAILWDRQFEADVAAGRLDELAEEALEDLREGRCTEL